MGHPGAAYHDQSLHTACTVGRFAGAYLTGMLPVPVAPWLTTGRQCLQAWTADVGDVLSLLSRVQEEPLVRRLYPASLSARLRHVWQQRQTLLVLLR
jgi:hypothetical protein